MAHKRGAWSWAVPVVMALAGLLFATTAGAARGSDLRGSGVPDLANVVRGHTRTVEGKAVQARELREQVEQLGARVAAGDPELARQITHTAELAGAAGTEAVTGPTLRVELWDAGTGDTIPQGYTVDDVVVHQQDVQAVVNALWAAGAEAMMIQDQRIISTSAVRCVGNTLILQGRVYSPPYVITALGDPAGLRAGLDRDPEVAVYRHYVDVVGLGYRISEPGQVTMPAFTGLVSSKYARVDRRGR